MSGVRSQRGFSMVELMMTVSIIMVVALIAVPSAMDGLNRQTANDTARAVMDIAEFARVQAASTNLAHAIFTTTGGGLDDSGLIEVWQGTTSACNYFRNPNPTTLTSATLVRTLDVTRDFPSTRIISTIPANMNVTPICYKPDGRVFQVVGDLNPVIVPAAPTSAYHAGEGVIRIQHMDGQGNPDGPVHAVRIPFNGLARKIVE